MKKIQISFVILLMILFFGCSAWMDGYYASAKPHKEQNYLPDQTIMIPKDYEDVVEILENTVRSGQKKVAISIEKIDEDWQMYMDDAAEYICDVYPMGTYAVSKISYAFIGETDEELLSVDISYSRSIADIDAVKNAQTEEEVAQILRDSLRGFHMSVAICVADYKTLDFDQIIRDYAVQYPQYVIEIPQVSAVMYPRNGKDRIVELFFNYENSRAALLQMKEEIRPIFEASEIVSGEGADMDKFARLYSFLMNYHSYTLQTAITPAYSLLHHGVGDSNAFAMVYAAMCRQAGLVCDVVSGTRDGKAWCWNVVQIEGETFYVDLLRCQEEGGFAYKTAQEMTGYRWNPST